MRCGRHWGRGAAAVLFTCFLFSCAPPASVGSFRLGPSVSTPEESVSGRVVVAFATPRSLLQSVRSWKPQDVARYDIRLAAVPPPSEPDAPASGTVDEDVEASDGGSSEEGVVASAPQPPAARHLALTSPGEAVFDDVPAGWHYVVTVEAWGNPGGGAPTQLLNGQRLASATVNLMEPGGIRNLTLNVPLDPVVFGATVRLPSTVDLPDLVPSWTTGFEAVLREDGVPEPLATASWQPNQRAQFTNVPGDRDLTLDVSYMSPAGSRTVTIPTLSILRTDGDTLFTPDLTPPPPPTGTQLGYRAFPGGAFMGSFDPDGRFWLTHQKDHQVSVVNDAIEPLLPAISVGDEPRGLAVDASSGEVWVANYTGDSVTHLRSDGSLRGTYNMGFLGMPSGITVDNQGRAWVASVFWGTVRCFYPDGTQLAGSPFNVGSQPTMVVSDPETGEIWVSNKGSDTIVKLNPDGSSAGMYFPGVTPGAIALTSEHTLWIVDTAGNQVLHMANDGVLLGDPVAVGAGPAGIAVDRRDDSVWIGIQNGAFVTKLDAAGHIVGSWPAGTFPGTLTVAPNGELWVVGDSGVSRLAP